MPPAGKVLSGAAPSTQGPLIGFLAVVRRLPEAGVELPVNIHFLIEGEEEIGSPSLEPHYRGQSRALSGRCDGALLPYLGTNTKGETPIRLGFKGLGFIEFSVEAEPGAGPAKHDFHAMHSGWLASPGWELISRSPPSKTANGRLTIDAFPEPPGPDEDDRALIAEAARHSRPKPFWPSSEPRNSSTRATSPIS
jgi:hypothetical protein